MNHRNHIICVLLIVGLLAGVAAAQEPGKGIRVEVGASASRAEKLAARELESYLQRMYPDASGKRIRLVADLPIPEAYEITGTADEAVINGGGPRGVLYGAYALLEKLGCRFYLTGDVVPPPKKEALSFANLKLSNRPLVATRMGLDWHNFLSGCSTWNLPEWQQYIRQMAKMGYNTIMVHTYGNNPMDVYSFNGKTKPYGWLPTTIKGRDWHTPHVNDVRRMVGGSAFYGPVFGADAALVPDEQRAEAARTLTQQIFDFAKERAMEVYWALDVDTSMANPKELISTLPEDALIGSGSISDTAATAVTKTVAPKEKSNLTLANPDHPDGYRLYKAHIETLLHDYPQITCLTVWFRMGWTPWLNLKLEQLPPAWQEEYRKATADTPAGETPLAAPEMLGIAKITKAFRRALDEIGRPDVKLAVGSWNFNPRFLAGLELFLPSEVPYIGLDYNIHHLQSSLTTPGKDHDALVRFASHRPLIPIIWSHGDDVYYYGRSFTPFAGFATTLEKLKVCGFGINHWTTRPFDLYFSSHIRQVWENTRNEPLETTCEDLAGHLLDNKALAEYLNRWATEAPMFGTAGGVASAPNQSLDKIVSGCDKRLAMLGTGGNAEVEYYRQLERFVKECSRACERYDTAGKLWEKGDWGAARAALSQCRPEEAIEVFAKTAGRSSLTRGELGQLTCLSLQWLPTVMRLRQMMGMEPIRCNFAPTWRESGQTRFIDEDRIMWDTQGVNGAEFFDAPQADKEIGRHGVQSAKPITLTVQPMPGGDLCPDIYNQKLMKEGDLCPGKYRLRLLLLDPDSTAPGQRVFKITVARDAGEAAGHATTVDVFKEAGGKNRLLELALPVKLSKPGKVFVTLTPVTGKAVLSGLVLERTGEAE
ncbi:MAG: hypothetical protein WCH57_11870 [Verrucomicrobiota bacterium]